LDPKGIPISIEQIPISERQNSEMFKKAPEYGEGLYNNSLFPEDMQLEIEIMKSMDSNI